MILPKRMFERRERGAFSHTSREKRVLGVDRLFRWKKHSKLAEKEQTTNSQKRKKNKGGQKAQTETSVKEQFFWSGSFIFPSNQKREKNNSLILTRESTKTCALCALFRRRRRRRRRERSERGLHSRRGRSSSRARGWVFCAREKERERFCFSGRKKLPHFWSRGIIIIIIIRGANLLSIKQQQTRTFKKRREK